MKVNTVSWCSLGAEALGSGWLVLCGCGSAVLAAGFLGVALAFGVAAATAGEGLGALTVAYFTPVIAVGMWSGGLLSGLACVRCVLAQCLGSVAAAGLLFAMVCTVPTFDVHQGFASNGYGDLSPGGFSLLSVWLTESVLAALVVIIVLGAAARGRPAARVLGGGAGRDGDAECDGG